MQDPGCLWLSNAKQGVEQVITPPGLIEIQCIYKTSAFSHLCCHYIPAGGKTYWIYSRNQANSLILFVGCGFAKLKHLNL